VRFEQLRSDAVVSGIKFLPRTLVKELVRTAIFWLNAVPPNHGVSKELTPHELLSGHRLDIRQDSCLKFDDFIHVHNGSDNTMGSRTGSALALRPRGTSRGTWLCYSRVTGKVIVRHAWNKLPFDQLVVHRVHALATIDGRPDLPNGYMLHDLEDAKDTEDPGDAVYECIYT